MTIAELFVNVGVRGNDKTAKALTSVKEGLGEVKTMSLEAKAALLGTMYALERLMSSSAAVGTGLVNFSSITGLSAKSLQQWQYGARQAGESAEEMMGSIKNVQNTVASMAAGKGAPEGMNRVAQAVGFDPKKMADTFYVMDKLREYAKVTAGAVGNDLAIANQSLRSFGVGDATIATMRRGMVDPSVRSKAPTYSDKETGQLAKVGAAWANLGNKIQMGVGHLSASHGLALVKDISALTTQVFKLVDAFAMLAEKLKLFEALGAVFQGWTQIFSLASDAVKNGSGTLETAKFLGKDLLGLNPKKGSGAGFAKGMNPSVRPAGGSTKNVQQTNNVKVDVHGVKGGAEAGAAIRHEINRALRQMPTQSQGS